MVQTASVLFTCKDITSKVAIPGASMGLQSMRPGGRPVGRPPEARRMNLTASLGVMLLRDDTKASSSAGTGLKGKVPQYIMMYSGSWQKKSGL